MRKTGTFLLSILLMGSMARGAIADVVVGITLSTSGPGAFSGADHLMAARMLPETIAGQKIRYIILNEESDPTLSTKNARKFVTEDNVDLLIGGTLTPSNIAVSIVAAETKTPQIALSPIDVSQDRFPWVFITAQDSATVAKPLFNDMKRRGIKTVAYMGFNDAFGEPWIKALEDFSKKENIQIVASERFARTDTSLTGQSLKIVVAKPDAVLVGAAGPASALVQSTITERGYKGVFYHTHGAASPAFLKSGGKAVEGALLTAGPMIVASQLPDGSPSKKVSETFIQSYRSMYGKEPSAFAGYMYDAGMLLQAALPDALAKAKPGTPEFRSALRSSFERVKGVAGVQGVYTMTPTDHNGHDVNSLVLLSVEQGAFKLVK